MENKADEAIDDARSFLAESRKLLEVCEAVLHFLKPLRRGPSRSENIMGKLEVHFEMGGIRNETYHPDEKGADWRDGWRRGKKDCRKGNST